LDVHDFDASYLFTQHALNQQLLDCAFQALVYQDPDCSVPSTYLTILDYSL